MKNPFARLIALVLVLLVTLAACVPTPAAQPVAESTLPPAASPTSPQATFNDPFDYCASVGTVDAPDARYTGPEIPDTVINGFRRAAGLEDSPMPLEILQKTTIWRCMDARVYACNFGANLPCSSQANTDPNPTQAMADFCAENPDAEFIPMSVTGHATIYSWHCAQNTPERLDQIAKVDAAGFLEHIWYPIEPNVLPAPTAMPESTPAANPLGSGHILFSSDRGGAYDDLYLLDLASVEVTRLTSGETNTFPGPFSPDGSQIAFTGFGLTTSYVGVMNADGSNFVNLTSQEVDEGFPAWSPEGSQIAFTSRRDGNNEIYVMDADGSHHKRLTNNVDDDFAPAWSPDGQQIAFASDRDNATGVYSIYLMNADGSGVKRLTHAGSDYTPAWSPDGTQIAFRSIQDGLSSDIYTIQVDGSGQANLTENPAEDWSPAWSLDGSQVVFQTDRDGNWEIYLMNADGSDPSNLTQDPADDQMPFWRPKPGSTDSAQGVPERVTLNEGSTTTSIQGQTDVDGRASYVIAAEAGQILMASIDNPEPPLSLEIHAPDGSRLVSTEDQLSYWQGTLEQTGDYTVTVISAEGGADLFLSLTLPQRVEFAPGATSASFEGVAGPSEILTYVLNGEQGKILKVVVTSPANDIFLTIYGLEDGVPYYRSAMDATSAEFELPASQDYVVKLVSTHPADEEYQVTFEVK